MCSLRHRLYELAVQTPELDVELLDRIGRRASGRAPRTLREDFCGTALLSACWVGSDDEREAVGVDLDRGVLAYARSANVAPLEDDAERIELVRGDVRALSDRTFDVITAMNSSLALFEDDALVEYARNARRCLEERGVLVIELFGGSEMRRVLTREHRHEGFTYVWEQRAFDPSRAVLDARIHFVLESGRELRDAFAYRFHLRSLAALEELLRAAGLVRSELLVEGRDGRYRRRASEPRAPLWRALLACVRA